MPDNIYKSGVSESGISHHRPIFCFLEDTLPENETLTNIAPKYDYCETNMLEFDKD